MFAAKLFLGLAGCVFLQATGYSETTILRLRADQWMPFNGGPDGEKQGYVVEALRAIFEPRGIKVDYQVMPWEDTLKAVRAGEVDGAIGANVTEGAELILGSEPIGLPKVGLFVRKDNPWKYDNLQSLNTTKLGAIASYSYWDSLDQYIKSHAEKNVVIFRGETPLVDALQKLAAKEIDVMPETLAVFIWGLKSQGLAFADYRAAYLHEGLPIYIAFAKNEQGGRFAAILDKGLRELRANGQLAKILSSYGMEDWKD